MTKSTGPALAFSRADAAFAAALRSGLVRARLGGVVDPGMGPVLFSLEERDVLSMSELASLAHVPRSTMTGVISRMEKRDLVRTAANPLDGRSVVVALTTKGRGVVPRLRVVERDLDATIGRAMTREELKTFPELMARFAHAFSTTPY